MNYTLELFYIYKYICDRVLGCNIGSTNAFQSIKLFEKKIYFIKYLPKNCIINSSNLSYENLAGEQILYFGNEEIMSIYSGWINNVY